ncbi:MAG: hypothetical protein AB1689_28615 [Thermodesulfobacteriota bacterium]
MSDDAGCGADAESMVAALEGACACGLDARCAVCAVCAKPCTTEATTPRERVVAALERYAARMEGR